MCYKDEVQKRNAAKLQHKFDEEGVPMFMAKLLFNKKSMLTSTNYWYVIKGLLLWLIENHLINKDSISEITPEDMQGIDASDINMYLKSRELSGISPTTLYAHRNIFSAFWQSMEKSPSIPVSANIVQDVAYRGIASVNNLYVKMPKEEDLAAMEEKIKRKPDEFIRNRNLAILNVMKGTGLRKCEIVELELSNLFLDGSPERDIPHIKVMGKGVYYTQEARMVLLDDSTKQVFEKWLEYRAAIENIADERGVFLNKNGKRITEDNVTGIFKTYSNGKLTPHMIRHWYGTVATQEFGVVFAQQQLGHKSADITTNSYVDASHGLKEKLASR